MATPLRLVASDRELQGLIEEGLELLQRLNSEAFDRYKSDMIFGLGECLQEQIWEKQAPAELLREADRVAGQLFNVS
jgi:hypothetical protein